jgi:hypothetical protein
VLTGPPPRVASGLPGGWEEPLASVKKASLKRQNAVLLAAVRNGVIVAKHAFYRPHMAFGTSDFVRSAEAPLFVVCCFYGSRKIEAVLQPCELCIQTTKAFGRLLGGAMFSRTYFAIYGAKVARAIAHGEPPLQAG